MFPRASTLRVSAGHIPRFYTIFTAFLLFLITEETDATAQRSERTRDLEAIAYRTGQADSCMAGQTTNRHFGHRSGNRHPDMVDYAAASASYAQAEFGLDVVQETLHMVAHHTGWVL